MPRAESAARSRRLVVVRAGDASLHPSWRAGPERPTFDLAVSYYGGEPKTNSDAVLVHRRQGGKWEGLSAFFADHPEALERYDWFWLPDDDIATTTGDLNRLFDEAEARGLEIAQPSLSWGSYFSHLITLNNPRFELRYTDYVEIMAPVLSAAMLRRVLPSFAGRRYGWGLDCVWPRAMPDPPYRAAILDTIAVHHSRPVWTSELYRAGTSAAREEMRENLSSFGISKPRTSVYAGIDRSGRRLERGPQLWAELYAGWRPLRGHRTPDGGSPLPTRRFIKSIWRVCLAPIDLSPVEIPER